MHAELNIPDDKDLLAQVGGSLDDRHYARTHDTTHYPHELYFNDKAVRVASAASRPPRRVPPPRSSASTWCGTATSRASWA